MVILKSQPFRVPIDGVFSQQMKARHLESVRPVRPRALPALWGLVLWLVIGTAPVLHAQEVADRSVARVAFVVDGVGSPFAEEVRDLVRQELIALARDDFDVRFPSELAVTADGTVDGIARPWTARSPTTR